MYDGLPRFDGRLEKIKRRGRFHVTLRLYIPVDKIGGVEDQRHYVEGFME